MKEPRLALVCDWLTSFGGAERVIFALHQLFPEAPLYTSVYDSKNLPQFSEADVRTSFIQKLPGARRHYQRYLGQMPLAFESFDLSAFDIVISSSHSCAKGIITKPETLHISYCHSPPRYLWDGSHQYAAEYPWPTFLKKTLIPGFLQELRIWDRAAADRVDAYIANSKYVAARIKKYYRRESEVIYPPVEWAALPEGEALPTREDYFLAVGRLIPYKRFDLIVQAFNALGLPLKIVGVGNQFDRLRKMAGPTIEFLGKISEEALPGYYRRARALIFPQVEDFGITPLEAMGYGCPVIAYAGGGALETIKDGVSGLFFKEQTMEGLMQAILEFDSKNFDAKKVRKQAEAFAASVFEEQFMAFVEKQWGEWSTSL